MTHHQAYMQRALFIAQRGAGNVAPNPLVGAVLVYDDEIIGEGWHQQFGYAHAEVNCINNVKESDKSKISKSTLYVNLEPCAHYGKTPPCAELIVKHNIPTVYIACKDPFAKVAGKGIEILKQAGIDVHLGLLEREAQWLNRRFFTFHKAKRPYIILKWAQSSDGFIAPLNGKKTMLSNALVQRYVHKMRSEEAAIMVGYQTAILDNPMLTNRFWGPNQPIRVVYDKYNALPNDLLIKTDGLAAIIFNNHITETIENCNYIKIENNSWANNLCNVLYEKDINSLIVEGGAKTLSTFLESGLWDEAHVITTPHLLQEGVEAPLFNNKILKDQISLEDNVVSVYTNSKH